MTDEEMWFRFFDTISKTNTYPDPLTVAQSATYCLEEYRRKFSHPTPNADAHIAAIGAVAASMPVNEEDERVVRDLIKRRKASAPKVATEDAPIAGTCPGCDGSCGTNDHPYPEPGPSPTESEARRERDSLRLAAEAIENSVWEPAQPAVNRERKSLGRICYEAYCGPVPIPYDKTNGDGSTESQRWERGAKAVRAEVLKEAHRELAMGEAENICAHWAVDVTKVRGIVRQADKMRAKR